MWFLHYLVGRLACFPIILVCTLTFFFIVDFRLDHIFWWTIADVSSLPQ